MLRKLIPTVLSGGGVDPYQRVVNGLTGVLAYWPLNEASGTTITDASGNNRGGEIAGAVTLNQAGQLGKCYQFPGTITAYIKAGASLRTAINQREFAVSFLAKVNVNAGLQVRLYNQWVDSVAEYQALECRSGDRLDVYLLEDGTALGKSEIGYIQDEVWCHIVFFNSESAGQCGVFLNRTYFPFDRSTLPGSDTPISTDYPQMGQYLDGWLQHVVWLDTGIPSQATVDALYYGAFAAASASAATVLADTFSVDESAPLASPRTSGLVVTDTSNRFAVSSGAVAWSLKTIDNADPRMLSTLQTRKVGRALLGQFTPGSVAVGWRETNTGTPNMESMLFQSGAIFVNTYLNSQMSLGTYTGSTQHKVALVEKLFGAFHLVKGGNYSEWTLLCPTNQRRTDLYGGFGVWNQNSATSVTDLHVKDLPAPFNTPFGLATTRLAGRVTAGTTFTHDADGLIEFTPAALPSGSTLDIRFRRQDASNYWQLTIDNGGNIVLNEVVAGVTTARTPSATTVTANDWLCLVLTGTTIRLLKYRVATTAHSILWTYSSATNFATATAGEVVSLGTAGRISDVVCWPRVLGATPAAVLDAAFV